MLPDLTVMGKVIGGGLPAAAYGGAKELMELVAPAGSVYQAGTLSGNPLAVAAGRAALQLLGEEAYLQLSDITLQLAEGLREAAGHAPGPGRAHDRPASPSSSPSSPCTTTRAPRPATPTPTAPGAARCWRAASTRRRRSSRPGSRRWPTRSEHLTRTIEAAAAAFEEIAA